MMIRTDIVSLDIEAVGWPSTGLSSIKHYLKSAAAITICAIAILASAYLAYQSPKSWLLATMSIEMINLYTLPKFLRYGNLTMIQMALVANLIAISSLSLGGIAAACAALGRLTLTCVKSYKVVGALFNSFYLTSLISYIVPLFQGALRKAYHLLQDVKFRERLASLQAQFNQIPELGLGWLQGNLWDSFVLQVTLFKPDIALAFCRFFSIALPHYAWNMAFTTNAYLSLAQFNHLLEEMEKEAGELGFKGEILSDEKQEDRFLNLKLALFSLKPEEMPQAIHSLLSQGSKLIPMILSENHFLRLFTGEILDATNKNLHTFLNLVEKWKDLDQQYRALHADAIALEQEIQNLDLQNLSLEDEKDLNLNYDELNQIYIELRKEVEKTYLNKRMWQDFAPLWGAPGANLPFDRSSDLLNILRDQNLWQDIEDVYRSLIAAGQGANLSLHDHLQHIKSKLTTLHLEEEKEEVDIIMYLAINRGFVESDYENLTSWLKLDSPHDLEQAFANIGLATEQDFYIQNIIPRQNQISKAEILDNLRHYIEKARKSKLTNRVHVYSEDHEDGVNQKSSVKQIIDQVTRAVYYAICSGFILVPLFIDPFMGALGFALGSCFFILKRFELPGTQAISDRIHHTFDTIPAGHFIHSLLRRRVFSLNPRRIELAHEFANENFIGRMIMINRQIPFVLLLSFLGSFVQGVALADEIIDLF